MNNGKAKIQKGAGFYSVRIPSKKNWFALIFGTAWLGGWFFGLISALEGFGFTTDGAIDGFLTFWLIGWTVGGLGIITLLLWGYFGQEKLEIHPDEIQLTKSVLGIGIKKKLKKKEVKNFRFNAIDNHMWSRSAGWAFWGLGPGKVKFDYGMRTYSFGLSLYDAEANHIVEELSHQVQ